MSPVEQCVCPAVRVAHPRASPVLLALHRGFSAGRAAWMLVGELHGPKHVVFFRRRRARGACRCWYSAPAPALANTCCSLAATGRGERLLCPPCGGDQVLDAPPEMPPPASPPPRGDRAICTRESAGPTQHVSSRIRAASAPSACSSLSSLKGRILSSPLVFGAAWLHLQRKSSHCTQGLRLRRAAG